MILQVRVAQLSRGAALIIYHMPILTDDLPRY